MKNKKLVKKPQILNGITLKTKPINVYKLHSCLDCQRIINDPRVQRIYDDWIDGYYVRPLVNYVNGEYRLIGGQHTVAAFIKRIENGLEETTTIECRVSENLSEAQESALFKYDEDCRNSQTYDSKLSAHWNYTSIDLSDEESRKLYDVNEILNQYGYTVKCNKNENMVVDCTETILLMDKETLHNVFNFVREIFPNEKCATQATFLKSIAYFLELFKEEIDMKKFKNATKATKTRKLLSASFLMSDSKNYVQYKGKTVKQIAYALAVAYQSRIKNGKLSLYKFDM